MKLIYLAALVLLPLFVWLGNGIRRIGAVSTGPNIGARGQTALLMIDLQTVFWEDGPYSDEEKTKARAAIQAEIDSAKAQGHPVIAIRHEWSIPATKVIARLTLGGQAIAGTQGTEIAPVFSEAPDHTLVKPVQDAFKTGALDELLETLDVGTLRIVGLDYNYCVLKTALAARNRNYDATLIAAGTLASADQQTSAEALRSAGVTIQ